ncbi:MAG: hypothetical protein A2Z14_01535 [Chloroflexi bacterium RBG_16_48_8]|nr:MAG: hypothetical protein A2Z14_01535 [Chloroflexi bacterium RBG_16_48_8]
MSVQYPEMNHSDTQESHNWDGGCLWSGVGVILGGLTLGLLFMLVSLTRISRTDAVSEPEIIIILPATDTPNILPTVSPQEPEDQVPTGSPGPLLGTDFTVGDVVEVYRTEGQGLSLRNEPSLSSVVGGYGLDSEILEIRGGPIQADGYVWWFLVSPYDNSKNGWGVGAFLRETAP